MHSIHALNLCTQSSACKQYNYKDGGIWQKGRISLETFSHMGYISKMVFPINDMDVFDTLVSKPILFPYESLGG